MRAPSPRACFAHVPDAMFLVAVVLFVVYLWSILA